MASPDRLQKAQKEWQRRTATSTLLLLLTNGGNIEYATEQGIPLEYFVEQLIDGADKIEVISEQEVKLKWEEKPMEYWAYQCKRPTDLCVRKRRGDDGDTIEVLVETSIRVPWALNEDIFCTVSDLNTILKDIKVIRTEDNVSVSSIGFATKDTMLTIENTGGVSLKGPGFSRVTIR